MRMASNVFRKIILFTQPSKLNRQLPRLYSSIYEPDYLEALKQKFPVYPPLTVQIRGYDFAILENYQSWVHRIANLMKFDIYKCYAMPSKDLKILRYKENTTVTEMEYVLKIHERDIVISNVPAMRLPIFVRIIESALPEGVMLDIDEYSLEKEKYRFVPDKELLDTKNELEQLENK